MYRNNSARAVPIIIFVIVAAALIFGLVMVGRYIFGGSSSGADSATISQAREQLLEVTADRSIQMTIRGPIVANEDFKTYDVTISPNERSYTAYTGYKDTVVSDDTLGNNTPAYEQFVYALDKAAFTKTGSYTESEASDLRGICATGRVYEFTLYNDTEALQHYWTSTCKGSPGTLGANLQQVLSLFFAQVPDADLGFVSSSTNQLSL